MKKTIVTTLALALVALTPWIAKAESTPSWHTDESAVSVGTGMRMMGGLLLCLGVLGAGVYLLKRAGLAKPNSRSSARMRVLERAPIGNRSNVSLVSIDGNDFLIATAGDSVAIQQVIKTSANNDILQDLEALCENSQL